VSEEIVEEVERKMKKKIKDLTADELKRYCHFYTGMSFDIEKCEKCPLYNVDRDWDCCYRMVRWMTAHKDLFNKEIEVPEETNNEKNY
jgi:hypothetical protein